MTKEEDVGDSTRRECYVGCFKSFVFQELATSSIYVVDMGTAKIYIGKDEAKWYVYTVAEVQTLNYAS
jgi:hypothetical protein